VVLVVEKLDRFSRLGIDETFELNRRLIKGGVELHLAKAERVAVDPTNKRDLGSRMTTMAEAYMDEMYSANLSERIGKAWALKKVNAAKEVLTANVPAWLEVVDGKLSEVLELKRVPVKKAKKRTDNVKVPGATVREAFRLAALGVGVANISNSLNGALGGLSLGWLTRTLSSRTVLGEYQPKKYVKVPGRKSGKQVPDGEAIAEYFPKIIDPDLFNAARAQAESKRKNGKPNAKLTGDRISHKADNLFSGLLYDVTTAPGVGLNFQRIVGKKKTHVYLYSAHAPGRRRYRTDYEKFETAFLGFLDELDWKSVARAAESDEVSGAAAEWNRVSLEADRVSRALVVKESVLEMSTDIAESRTLTPLVTKLRSRLTNLTEEKEALSGKLDSARARSEALYRPEDLLALIRSNTPEGDDVRLRLRTEIRKRIARIEVSFGLDGFQAVCDIRFVNGVQRGIILDGERALLLRIEGSL